MDHDHYVFLADGGAVHTAWLYGGPVTVFGSYQLVEKGVMKLSLDRRGDSQAVDAPFEWKGKGFVINVRQPRQYLPEKRDPDPLLGIWKRSGDPKTEDEVGYIFVYGREAIIGNSGFWNEDRPRRGLGGPYSLASYRAKDGQLEEEQNHRGHGVGMRKRTFQLQGDKLQIGELSFQRARGKFPIDAQGFHQELWDALK